MNESVLRIMDLPDEMIMKMWSYLTNIEILYSFFGINKRFDRLARDPSYIHSIQLAEKSGKEKKYSPLSHSMIDRFSVDIFPRIHQYIECLVLEPLFMEDILLAAEYPRLHKLVFTQVNEDFLYRHFNDQSALRNLFQRKISHLTVTIDMKGFESESTTCIGEIFFSHILNTFPNLIELDLNENSIDGRPLIPLYGLSSITCYSTSLISLSISVNNFDDCLCSFDGRFPQLRKLSVVIAKIDPPSLSIIDLRTLPQMKYFSVSSYRNTDQYDNQILPLIRQMNYLEELSLSIVVDHQSIFIDGTHLKNEMIIYLPHLQSLTFNISTHCEMMSEQMYLQSNSDISQTFLHWPYGQVASYISHYPNNYAQSHIFSVQCNINDIYSISYGFQGGLYRNVRILYLSDRVYPFDHEFFLRIARAFPLITDLTVLNNRIPNDIQQTNNQTSSIVQFNHLTSLTICFQRPIYLEQFLVDTKTSLPKVIRLKISYDNLLVITDNFTRDDTRRNCSKVQTLTFTISTSTERSKEFYSYFPCLK